MLAFDWFNAPTMKASLALDQGGGSMKIKRIEHVAIAVSDVGNMAAVLRDVLGLKLDYIEDLQKARVAFFPLGDSAIELVQGIRPEAQSAKWVAEKGQSLYHICLEVEDIDSALDELRGKGIKLINDTPIVGHGQCRIAFINPSCTGNILFELAEPSRQETR
jgi:methylmalonyl-CoA/ethylmalonyl-CoA epimerase